MSEFQIRRAEVADVTSIAVLGTQVWLDTYTKGVSALCADFVLQEFAVAQMSERIHKEVCWVAVRNELLLAYLFVDPIDTAPWGAEVSQLYVQAQCQGQGVGAALLNVAKQAFPQFWLSVNCANEKAIQFYRQQGLQQVGETDFMLGEQCHKNFVFALGLS